MVEDCQSLKDREEMISVNGGLLPDFFLFNKMFIAKF